MNKNSKTLNSLTALALDLKRVALGFQRGSISMAERFMEEARARKQEIVIFDINPYLARLLDKMEESFRLSDNSKKAEDALMYSTLLQNAAQKLLTMTL